GVLPDCPRNSPESLPAGPQAPPERERRAPGKVKKPGWKIAAGEFLFNNFFGFCRTRSGAKGR
ncbi:MAG TPA: hypothetical protein VL527_04125, partial [Dongiaceae bacterium]|nr:hypothetical protein [Dongiaceae bacterium]